MKSTNTMIMLLLGNIFLTFLGIGLIIPVLPTLMNELHITGTIVGYMVAFFALVQLLISPLAGRWVDQVGRKKIIVYGLLIFSISEFLFGIGKDVWVLFLSRGLGGISAAFIMPAATAYIADVTSLENRAKVMGYLSAAISTGFIIGPGVGGFLADFGIRTPFFFAALLGAIAAILSMLFLQEPKRNVEYVEEQEMKTSWKRIFAPIYFIAFLVIFILSFGLASFESIFSLYIDHKFQFSPTEIAIVISGGGIVGAIAQLVLFDRLTKWMGEVRLIIVSLLFSAILVFTVSVVNTYISIFLATIFVFVGFDLIRPAVTSYLSKIAGNEQGFVAGMNSMFTSIGNVIGPILGGMLFDIHYDYPYYFAATVLFIGVIISLRWKAPAYLQKPSVKMR